MSRFMLLWATVTLSAAVGGCGTNEPAKAKPRELMPAALAPAACGGNVKEVKVRNITTVSTTGAATITVQKKALIARGRAGANWKLQTAGYVFAAAGVVIATPPGPALSYGNGSDEFGWCFDTAADWHSKYTIYFRATANPTVIWQCDPMIANYGGETVTTLADEVVSCSVFVPLKPLP
ncbi:MAG: hypothetical protein V4569_17020 [Pseudomonadota bacterium]